MASLAKMQVPLLGYPWQILKECLQEVLCVECRIHSVELYLREDLRL